MSTRWFRPLLALLIILVLTAPLAAQTDEETSDTAAAVSAAVSSLRMREIGPSVMGGRIADVEVSHQNPSIVIRNSVL